MLWLEICHVLPILERYSVGRRLVNAVLLGLAVFLESRDVALRYSVSKDWRPVMCLGSYGSIRRPTHATRLGLLVFVETRYYGKISNVETWTLAMLFEELRYYFEKCSVTTCNTA